MFESLSDRLNRTLKNISGQGRITEDNVKDTLREVRTALLEADVALPVVRDFTARVKEKALGMEVNTSLTPGQQFVSIVHDQLIEIMGASNSELNLAHQPPAVILLAGLQGAGKTTSAAKLGLYIKERLKKSIMMCSVDTYRPAAIEQLHTLGRETGIETWPSDPSSTPQKIAAAALEEARRRFIDVLIIDTAGRLAVDEDMMNEVKELHGILEPVETMFVVDAMTGQDAANTAKAFAEALPLTGVILTKADGDARGGAALSVRQITGKPIKFIGLGEKVVPLEPFHPDRIAGRILGMGDVLSLVEELQLKTDKEKADRLVKKLKKGEGFDLNDFLSQMVEMKKMGGVTGLISKLPGGEKLMAQAGEAVSEKNFSHIEAIILSMTPKERAHPEIIKGSRKKRIAAGCGLEVQEVNRLLTQFEMMQKMMKKLKGGKGMRAAMNAMRGMAGGMGGMGGLAGLLGNPGRRR
ncbi:MULTISPECIES: signal recognition particle protein [unclassified Anaerobiospirillum]|uniref:signal recognition particle protein n=1 Tax=unclassified Anaerobiospirillum TaxID=2647410 RepID=UPI001FF2D92A|nr:MULTISPECIES: signal recognition particle protein [unclassified Anaerobiospirillum]MCK0526294.1 signal recognition particle protein [Anaerobiospirillum sp. NML120449]MCK0535310.1 signal recognition particle protein [Anaerobiospirillum sp. NML120511]MCK0540495.1 signal recognition particle protein [Anaerobiospirillum sp. NML02-A-032]